MLKQALSLAKLCLPGGLAWYFVAASAAAALAGGIWFGSVLQTRQTDRVQREFDLYKIADLEDSNAANARTVFELRRLADNQEQMRLQLREALQADEAFSTNLIKELNNANGQSCPLSPAVRAYVDSVRNHATGAGVD